MGIGIFKAFFWRLVEYIEVNKILFFFFGSIEYLGLRKFIYLNFVLLIFINFYFVRNLVCICFFLNFIGFMIISV